ncbi:MAG: pectin acetylesterase-family hydrolase [Chloroflexota bacterium]
MRTTFIVSIITALCLIFPMHRPVAAMTASHTCLSFEDLSLGNTYANSDSFTSSGVGLTVAQFKPISDPIVITGTVKIDNQGLAGGVGHELAFSEATAILDWSGLYGASPLNDLSLRFGEYNGHINLLINGTPQVFENMADIDGTMIGGVNVSVTSGLGNDAGTLVLQGSINNLAIGGADFVLDDVCLNVSQTLPSHSVMHRFEIDQVTHPNALYNDGSTPLFYYRRGTGDGANKWVIWFKGGGSCFSDSTCLDRETDRVSATPWLDVSRLVLHNGYLADGIFNANPANNADFYNWNHVYMVYGSSDSWAGTSQAMINGQNTYFHGHYVTNAIIDALKDTNLIGSPNLLDATHVVFSGSSAGANGMRNNLDRLAGDLQTEVPGVDIRAIGDAAVAPNVDAASQASGAQIQQDKMTVWNPSLDESCTTANPGNPGDCLRGEFLLDNDEIATPIFIHQDQLDSLSLDNRGYKMCDSDGRPVIDDFAAEVRRILRAESGAFSPRTGNHILVTSDKYRTIEVDGLSMAEVVHNWYTGGLTPTVVIQAPSATDYPECSDLGDAPDSDFNHHGVTNQAYSDPIDGHFPTVWESPVGEPSGPKHDDAMQVWLGDRVTGEEEADVGADVDGLNNILDGGLDNADNDEGDDGWLNPTVPFPHCERTTLQVQVTRSTSATQVGPMFINVWFDGIRDGDWEDQFVCPGVEAHPFASEWIVRNYQINANLIPAGGSQVFNINTYRIPNQDEEKDHWIRFTLSEDQLPVVAGQIPDGRGPHSPNSYQFGETEDYLQVPQVGGEPGTFTLDKTIQGSTDVVPGDIVSYTVTLSHQGGTAPIMSEIADILPRGVRLAGIPVVTTEGVGATPTLARVKRRFVGWRGLISPDSKLHIAFPVEVRLCPTVNHNLIENIVTADLANGQSLSARATLDIDCSRAILPNDVTVEVGFPNTDGARMLDAIADIITRRRGRQPIGINVTNNTAQSQFLRIIAELPTGVEMRIGSSGLDGVDVDPFVRRTSSEAEASPSFDKIEWVFDLLLQPNKTRQLIGTLIVTEDFADGTELSIPISYCIACDETLTAEEADDFEQELPPLQITIKRRDLGDAPDSTNHFGVAMAAYAGVPANYPTVRDASTGLPPGPAHLRPNIFHLGPLVTREREADVGPDEDATNNILPAANIPDQDGADDGLLLNTVNFVDCQPATFQARVFIDPAAVNYFSQFDGEKKAYLNSWYDANQDGDWDDGQICAGLETTEHIVIDAEIDVLALGTGLHTLTVATTGPVPATECIGWMRLMLSERPSVKPLTFGSITYGDGRGDTTPYAVGEVEDYRRNCNDNDPNDGPDLILQVDGQWVAGAPRSSEGRNASATTDRQYFEYVARFENIGATDSDGTTFTLDILGGPGSDDFRDEDILIINGDRIIQAPSDCAGQSSCQIEIGTVPVGGQGRVIVRGSVARSTLAQRQVAPATFGAQFAIAHARDINPLNNKVSVSLPEGEIVEAPIITDAFVDVSDPANHKIIVSGTAQTGVQVTVYRRSLEGSVPVAVETSTPVRPFWTVTFEYVPDGTHLVYAYASANGETSPVSNERAVQLGPLPFTQLQITDELGRRTPLDLNMPSPTVFVPGRTYNLAMTPGLDDLNLQLTMNFPEVDLVELTDEDGDGTYTGQMTIPATGRSSQTESNLTFTMISGQTEKTAETQTVIETPSGTIYNPSNGQSIEGATIDVLEARKSQISSTVIASFNAWDGEELNQPDTLTTSTDGSFDFTVPNGLYRLFVERDGYQTYLSRDVTVEAKSLVADLPLTPEVAQDADHIIQMTDTGFEPAIIIISVGDVVEWINADLAEHTTISTTPELAYPSQTGNNAWDSGVLTAGDSYKQAFDQVGVYTYIDALNPGQTATIIVSEAASDVGQHSLFLPVLMK